MADLTDFEAPGPGVVTAGDLVGLRRETTVGDPKPTIRVDGVCRSDGRCPECKRSMGDRRGQLALLPLLPCGCHCCAKCATDHARALLIEALRQLSEAQAKLRPVRRVDPGFVIAPEDESNG